MQPLEDGEVIGLVSPASVVDLSIYRVLMELVERNGFGLKIFGANERPHGKLAATDERRLKHLLDAFSDAEVRAVMCTRGGYGCGRLLEAFGPESITDKIFIGYSDVTSLLCHFRRHRGLIPFHGPMAADLALKDDSLTQNWLFSTLRGRRLSYDLVEPAFETLRPGTAHGPVFGGNITILQSLLGTDSITVPDGAILLLEDVNEFMYAFDRSLVHLRRAGVFEKASGIIFADLFLKDGANRDNSLGMSLEEVLEAHFHHFGGPIAYGLPCGHTTQQMTIPLGAPASLTIGQGRFYLGFDDYWNQRPADRLAA